MYDYTLDVDDDLQGFGRPAHCYSICENTRQSSWPRATVVPGNKSLEEGPQGTAPKIQVLRQGLSLRAVPGCCCLTGQPVAGLHGRYLGQGTPSHTGVHIMGGSKVYV
jgi:hypothetical protein